MAILANCVSTAFSAEQASPNLPNPVVSQSKEHTIPENGDWIVPSLADTTLRAGRSTIQKTADTWHPYLSVRDSADGLHFSFTKAVGTVFEGLSRKVDLNGLFLKFTDFENRSPNSASTFALSFGKGEYDRFSFGFIFDPKNGKVFVGQRSNSALAEIGDAIIEDASLTTQGLQGQTWTLLLQKEFNGNYTLQISIGGKVLSAQIAESLVENGSYDPHNCCLSIMAVKNLPSFDLTLAGYQQIAVPEILSEEATLLRGTGNFEKTLHDWEKWLTVTPQSAAGLRYAFTAAPHSVTEGLTIPLSLSGLRVYFSDLESTDLSKIGRLALTFGTGNLVRSSFGLLFDFGKGKVYVTNAELANGVPSSGRIVPVGDPIFFGDSFLYENMKGKNWFVDFSQLADGNYNLILEVEGSRYEATVPSSVVRNDGNFRPDHCYGYLMSAQANTTVSINLKAITRRAVPRHTDNSTLLPQYMPSTNVSVDENGTPSWLNSAVIMELNIPRATKEGTLDSATSILNHVAEMGVNCIWLTSVSDPGTKNDGTAGNHYVNKGLHTIDPAITGATSYAEGWDKLADFVEEAHKRNIYVIFNAITWGTCADSSLYEEHPQWYTGKDIWSGKAWDWSNEELICWYTDTLLDIIETTHIDGILYDCEPEYAGEAVCARFRTAIREAGHNLVYIAESVNNRSNAYDMELYGVMDYRGYNSSSAAIGTYQKNHKEFFLDSGYDIVEAVQQGLLNGSAEEQQNGSGGKHKYYSYCFSNHDSYYFTFDGDLMDVAYQGLLSPYIPIWYLGDEFNSTPSGIRLYFDATKWSNLASVTNSSFFEDLKEILRIRRQFRDVFEVFTENHRETNICKIAVSQDLGLTAYGRYADNTAILVMGNRSSAKEAVTVTVTVPFEEMNLTSYDTFTLTDLLSNEVICRGTKEQVEQFAVTLDYDAMGIYALVGVGTAHEGITLAEMHHTMYRNGTSHMVNTAVNNWGKYLQVQEAPLGAGLRFSFTEAVTTVAEGINAPVSLDDLSLHFSNLSGYVNHGTASAPSQIALSFGTGGYNRNHFAVVLDFTRGRIYAATPTQGTTDRLTLGSAPLLESELLKASALGQKEWSVHFCKADDGNYDLIFRAGSTSLKATVDGSYLAATDSFDPTNCYLYFMAAGAKPTVTFDFVGWGTAESPVPYFAAHHVAAVRGTPSVTEQTDGTGLQLHFQNASPLTGITLAQEFDLDGTALYFDDLCNFDQTTPNAKFALTFSSVSGEDTAFGLAFDPQKGAVYLVQNGYLSYELLSDPALLYHSLRNHRWSLHFKGTSEQGLTLTMALPDKTLVATVPYSDLSQSRHFTPNKCILHVIAWDSPLSLTLRLVGYEAPLQKEEEIPVFHSLSLESSIAINYMVPKTALQDFDSFQLHCTLPVYKGNAEVGEKTVTISPQSKENGYWCFPLTGLNALQMNDTILAQLSMEKNGVSYLSVTDAYSVAQYACSLLRLNSASPSHKKLCANLLQYGSAAQIWKGYRTDALPLLLLTEAEQSLLTDPATVLCADHSASMGNLPDPPVTFIGRSLIMEEKVVIRLYFNPGSLSDNVEDLSVRVSYTNIQGNSKTVIYDDLTPYPTISGSYYIEVDCLNAAEMRTVIHATVCKGDTPVSDTIQYSIESYAATVPGTVALLCKAMLAYGDAAAELFSR